MKKINQEEYEVLKGLDGRWKWITRDRVTELWVYTEKPYRKGYRWGSAGHFNLLPHRSKYLFQFIQWKDEEPYNIAELIEEYERGGIEVKKDKLWAKNKIQEELESWRNIEGGIDEDGINYVLNIIDQIDEPEVLTQEWIDEYSYNIEEYWEVADMMVEPQYAVSVENLQNLLVPKPETLS